MSVDATTMDPTDEGGGTLHNCSELAEDILDTEFQSAAFLMIVLFCLYCSSVISHFIGSAKVGPNGEDRWWILCIPDSMITMLLGMILGGFLQVGTINNEGENHTHVLLDDALFDVELFNLVLLPIIIFTSGYTLTPKSLFFKQIGSIILLAIAGTIICAFIIGGVLFAVFESSTTLPHLSFVEMMIFGSLIAAIDPVATLSIFMKLKVDPRLSMILFGESIINDAVSIVLYTTFTTFVGLCGDIGAVDILRAIGIFLGIFIGSLVLAIIISMCASISMKYVQMHSPLHQAMVMFLWSYMSFELATVCQLSGICCSLFSGIFMGYLVPKSQSTEDHKFTISFFHVLAELAESVVFFQIGLNAVIFNVNKDTDFPWLFSLATFLLCVLARIVAVSVLAGLMNVRRKKTRFTWQQIVRSSCSSCSSCSSSFFFVLLRSCLVACGLPSFLPSRLPAFLLSFLFRASNSECCSLGMMLMMVVCVHIVCVCVSCGCCE